MRKADGPSMTLPETSTRIGARGRRASAGPASATIPTRAAPRARPYRQGPSGEVDRRSEERPVAVHLDRVAASCASDSLGQSGELSDPDARAAEKDEGLAGGGRRNGFWQLPEPHRLVGA